jgi:hypothetical protein
MLQGIRFLNHDEEGQLCVLEQESADVGRFLYRASGISGGYGAYTDELQSLGMECCTVRTCFNFTRYRDGFGARVLLYICRIGVE